MNPWVIILAGALLIQNVKLPAFLVKHPPTAELVAAQKEVEASKVRETAALSELAKAKADQQSKTDAQLAYAQQMANGAGLALGRVKPEQMTPEIRLATDLNTRAIAGLDAAKGKLSPEMQQEMSALIDNALSAVTAQRDAAMKALADKDAELKVSIIQKEEIAAKLPVLEATVTTETAARQVVEAKHNSLEKVVTLYAEQKDAAETKAGSLEAYVGRLLWIVGITAVLLAGLYYVAHFGLPSLQQEFPDNQLLLRADKLVKSIATSRA